MTNVIMQLVTDRLRRDAVLDVLRELSTESVVIILLQLSHVVCHVLTKDVLTMNISVELLAFTVIAWESLCPDNIIHSIVIVTALTGKIHRANILESSVPRYHKFYTTIRIVKKYHDTRYYRYT